MTRNKTFSLHGGARPLLGENDHNTGIVKAQILNAIVLPFLAQDWEALRNNMFLLDTMKSRLAQNFSADNSLYSDIVSCFELAICDHLMGGDGGLPGEGKSFADMTFRTSIVRLKPEYELYHLILGVPEDAAYNQDTLASIAQMVASPDLLTFVQIQQRILQNKKR